MPGMIRVAWSIISLQGFASNVVRMPWECVQEVHVSGLPMSKTLTITGTMFSARTPDLTAVPPIARSIGFPEVAFVAPIDEVASVVRHFAADPTLRGDLESWEGMIWHLDLKMRKERFLQNRPLPTPPACAARLATDN